MGSPAKRRPSVLPGFSSSDHAKRIPVIRMRADAAQIDRAGGEFAARSVDQIRRCLRTWQGFYPFPPQHKTLEAKVGIEPAYTALQAAA